MAYFPVACLEGMIRTLQTHPVINGLPILDMHVRMKDASRESLESLEKVSNNIEDLGRKKKAFLREYR